MKHKKIIYLISILLVVVISIFLYAVHIKTQIKDLFRMNKELQEENYYMADFEFKMMGLAYWLDHGQYYKALSQLGRLHKQLEAREGLIKVPEFTGKQDELEFYLNLQNPNTGAFMDDSYPYCTYNEPTENILAHLDMLSQEAGKPLRLKYPLRYLDEINDPEELKTFLEDVSNVGWIAARLPQTTFVFARSLLSYCNGEGVIGELNLYNFSPEWKKTLLQWFYINQDPHTGFWGPKSSSGQILKKDLNNTASIIKTFIDKNGNDIYEAFPLRYKREMFRTALEVMAQPMPAADDFDECHEWALKMGKGTTMLTRYLWKDALKEDKAQAKALIESYVKIIFEKYYVGDEGAFSYYPDSEQATLDGTGSKISYFINIGFFSAEKQKELWGSPDKNINDLGVYNVSTLTEDALALINNNPEINSLRFYDIVPALNDLTAGVCAVSYPQKTVVLDVMDFTPKIKAWLNLTSQSMGNWVSKEEILQSMNTLEIEAVPVYEKGIFPEAVNEFLQKQDELVVYGFDILQIPRCKIIFEK